jgi:hypothetical protein
MVQWRDFINAVVNVYAEVGTILCDTDAKDSALRIDIYVASQF